MHEQDAREMAVLVAALLLIGSASLGTSRGLQCYCSTTESIVTNVACLNNPVCETDYMCFANRYYSNSDQRYNTEWGCLKRLLLTLIPETRSYCSGGVDSANRTYKCCNDSNNCNKFLNVTVPAEMATTSTPEHPFIPSSSTPSQTTPFEPSTAPSSSTPSSSISTQTTTPSEPSTAPSFATLSSTSSSLTDANVGQTSEQKSDPTTAGDAPNHPATTESMLFVWLTVGVASLGITITVVGGVICIGILLHYKYVKRKVMGAGTTSRSKPATKA